MRIHLGYIDIDSSLVVNTLHVSGSLHQNIVHHRRAFPKLCKLQRRSIENSHNKRPRPVSVWIALASHVP